MKGNIDIRIRITYAEGGGGREKKENNKRRIIGMEEVGKMKGKHEKLTGKKRKDKR